MCQVNGLQLRCEPGRQVALWRAEKIPQPLGTIGQEQCRRIAAAQKVHVLAGRLLRRVVLQLTHKSTGVWCVDDEQLLQRSGMLNRQIPCQRATPVVGDHGGRWPTGAFGGDQCHQVLHQSFGFVSVDR